MYVSIHNARGGTRRVQRRHQVVYIGRDRNCTIVIDDDPEVAPHHLSIEPRIEGAEVSRSGGDVLVNGTPITDPVRVRFRDQIQIGATTLQLAPDWRRSAPPAWSSVPPPYVRREQLAEAPIEHALLADLRRQPGDAPTRTVYADWLLERGHLAMAAEVSGRAPDPRALLRESTAEWRAIAGRSPIMSCDDLACPRAWDALGSTENERARSCGTCTRAVRFCERGVEIRGCIARGDPYVPDLALAAVTGYTERIDAALRAIIDTRWQLDRRSGGGRHDAWWTVEVGREGVISSVFQIVLEGATVHFRYGGSDRGLLDITGPPRQSVAELQLVGLDDETIAAWLDDAFDTLPPHRWGYT